MTWKAVSAGSGVVRFAEQSWRTHVIFGGGLPVRDHEGALIGAIGVSGGSTEQDIACAEYAVNNFTQGS